MSTLGNIATAALRPFAKALGPSGQPSELVIGSGQMWQGTINEERTTRDYMEGGQQVEISQTIVGSSAEFTVRYPETSDEYLGKTATLDGKARRISELERGEAFTTITLTGSEEAP